MILPEKETFILQIAKNAPQTEKRSGSGAFSGESR